MNNNRFLLYVSVNNYQYLTLNNILILYPMLILNLTISILLNTNYTRLLILCVYTVYNMYCYFFR